MAFCAIIMATVAVLMAGSNAANTNMVHQPCADAKIQRSDGFTFGIAFSSKDNFYYNNSHQLTPCDRRLSLASLNSQLALFRPKVDEISLLSINTSTFFPVPFTSISSLDLRLIFWGLVIMLIGTNINDAKKFVST